jgi:hypothetical protein
MFPSSWCIHDLASRERVRDWGDPLQKIQKIGLGFQIECSIMQSLFPWRSFCSWLLDSSKTTMFTSLHVCMFLFLFRKFKAIWGRKVNNFVVCVNVCVVIHICVFHSSFICPPFLPLLFLSSYCSLFFIVIRWCSLLLTTNVC